MPAADEAVAARRRTRTGGGVTHPETVTGRPWNAATPIAALQEPLTPNDRFFVRNHFDAPRLDPETYLLHVADTGRRVTGFTLAKLERLPQRRVTAVLECAGNARHRMAPRPPGLPWGDGAVGCATWEGPSLRDVLASAGLPPRGVEVLFGGADVGEEEGRVLRFERSLPLGEAMREDVIVALRMNGEALRPAHGAPARLVVPGWYAVASVKWLRSVRLLERRFTGWFQRQRYVWDDGSPVTSLRIKTLILRPTHGARVQAGPISVEGRAWGGAGVAEVRVRLDDGPFQAAALNDLADAHAWHAWSTLLELPPGAHRVMARARDTQGRWQPLEPVVNRLGYGYNTAHTVRVQAISASREPEVQTAASRPRTPSPPA